MGDREAGHGRLQRPQGVRRGAMAVMALSVLATLGGVSGAGASSSGPANPNGVLRYGEDLVNGFSNNFDPGLGTNDCSYAELAQIYDSITYTPAGNTGNTTVAPGIAQSWTVQGSTLTLHLRPGVSFSNGEPVDATAVMNSIEHVRKSPLRTSLLQIKSMDPVDAHTLVITMNQPPTAGDLVLAFSFIDGMVMAPSSIASASTKPVGSGPFILKSYQPGSEIAMVANRHYWNRSQYKLGGVDFVELAPGPQAVGALISGAVDMIDVQPEDYATVKANPSLGLAVTRSSQYMLVQLRENTAPFDNPTVREALEYGINRAEINKVVLNGLGEPAYQPFPSWSAAYNKAVGTTYQYKPSKAKALLASAGYPKGVSFSLAIPGGEATYQRAAQIMQAELAPAGFHLTIAQIPGGDIFTQVYEHKQGNAVLVENSSNGPDYANNFESSYLSSGFVANALGSVNPTLTPLIEQSLSSLSPKVQGPLMQQASKIVMSQGLEVPVAFIPEVVGYNKARVGGTVVAPIGYCKANLRGIYIKR